MLMQAIDACENKWLKVAFHLAFAATVRIGELLGLTWDCVDVSEEAIAENRAYIFINKQVERVSRNAVDELDSKEVILIFPSQRKNNKTVRLLKTPKTDTSERKVYIPKFVAQILVDIKREQEELKDILGSEYQDYNLVMATTFGLLIGDSYLRDQMQKVIDEQGLSDVVFHSLRHTSVTCMNSYAKYIETVIEQEPENKLLEASILYQKSFGTVPEMTCYKTLERMSKQGSLVHLTKGLYYRPKKSRFGTIPISEKEIIGHYTNNGRGILIGYRLYNQKGLTTQISKRVEVLSSAVTEQKKNIQNVCVTNSGIDLTKETIPVIETMEIFEELIAIVADYIGVPADAVRRDYYIVQMMQNLQNSEYAKSVCLREELLSANVIQDLSIVFPKILI